MCGIVLMSKMLSSVDGPTDSVLNLSTSRNLFAMFIDMMLSTQERGEDASGIAMVGYSGNTALLKMATTATKLMSRRDDEAEKDATKRDIDTFLKLYIAAEKSDNNKVHKMLGHCRKSSVGSKANENNHPVMAGNSIAVHNGTLKNHAEVITARDINLPGTVDTRAIVGMFNQLSDDGNASLSTKMGIDIATELDGSMATLCFNINNPHQVLYIKRDRPIEMAFLPDLGIVVVTSVKSYLERAISQYNVSAKMLNMADGIKEEDRIRIITSVKQKTVIDRTAGLMTLYVDKSFDKIDFTDFLEEETVPIRTVTTTTHVTYRSGANTRANTAANNNNTNTSAGTQNHGDGKSGNANDDKDSDIIGALFCSTTKRYMLVTDKKKIKAMCDDVDDDEIKKGIRIRDIKKNRETGDLRFVKVPHVDITDVVVDLASIANDTTNTVVEI